MWCSRHHAQGVLLDTLPAHEVLDGEGSEGAAPGSEHTANDNDEEALARHHKEAYIARKLLPLLCGRHAARWPGSTTEFNLNPSG